MPTKSIEKSALPSPLTSPWTMVSWPSALNSLVTTAKSLERDIPLVDPRDTDDGNAEIRLAVAIDVALDDRVAAHRDGAQLGKARADVERLIVADSGEALIAGELGVGIDGAEVDGVAAGHTRIFEADDGVAGRDGLAAVLDLKQHEGVGPVFATQPVSAEAAGQKVVAAVAGKIVGALAADDQVGGGAALDNFKTLDRVNVPQRGGG